MSKNVSKNKEFLRLYAIFEDFLGDNFSDSPNNSERINEAYKNHNFAQKAEKLGFSKDDMHNLRQLRNIIVHRSNYLSISSRAIADINKIVLNFCRLAQDIATPRRKIYSVNLRTPIQHVIRRMDRNDYSYVPIVNKNHFEGLFSLKIVLHLSAQNKTKQRVLIQDILPVIKGKKTEDKYAFLRSDAPAEAVYQLFSKYSNEGEALGVILLTSDGQESGKFEGLITSWDLYKTGQDT